MGVDGGWSQANYSEFPNGSNCDARMAPGNGWVAWSPDLGRELLNAIMSAMDAHATMSTQALNSEAVRLGMLSILLDHARLYEGLCERGAGA